jgi:hypothetical protein
MGEPARGVVRTGRKIMQEKTNEATYIEKLDAELERLKTFPSGQTVSFGDLHKILDMLVKGK